MLISKWAVVDILRKLLSLTGILSVSSLIISLISHSGHFCSAVWYHCMHHTELGQLKEKKKNKEEIIVKHCQGKDKHHL